MKKLVLLLACLVVMTANAQNSGLGFNYQAVVRNSEGIVLTDTLVNLRVSLYPGQHASTPTWVETHSTRTDFTGAFGITIGQGERDASSLVEDFDALNFAAIFYWQKIEILEGDAYQLVSYSQIPIAPIAKYALVSPFPAGIIVPFAGDVDNIPTGWMLCDGRELSRSANSMLFGNIGTSWGNGDGSTTFNIPDLRGVFLRGVSGDSGNDPDADERYNEFGGNQGNGVGTYQNDAIRNIEGTFAGNDFTDNVSQPEVTGAFYKFWSGYRDAKNGAGGGNYGVGFNAGLVVPVGGDNRPINASVNYIIKL